MGLQAAAAAEGPHQEWPGAAVLAAAAVGIQVPAAAVLAGLVAVVVVVVLAAVGLAEWAEAAAEPLARVEPEAADPA